MLYIDGVDSSLITPEMMTIIRQSNMAGKSVK